MLRLFIRLLLKLLFRVEIQGQMQRHERMLITPNHQSLLDAMLLWAFLPVEATWLVHTVVARNSFFSFLLRAADHLVVDTSSPMVMKASIALIEAGKPVVIFPEGRITVTGSLMKIYEGPAFVAARTGAKVCPVRIEGAVYASWFTRVQGDFPRRWFPKITIKFFPPLVIPLSTAETGKIRRRISGDILRHVMQETQFKARTPKTIPEAFLDAIQLFGRRREMLEDALGGVSTYGKLLKGTLALGRLVSKHTQPGEVVGVMMPNVTATIPLLLGMMATRRIPAVLNYSSGHDALQSALIGSRAKLLITSRAFLERGRLGHLIEQLSGVRVLYLEDLRPELTLGDKLWLMLRAMPFPRSTFAKVRPDDPAVVLFTSGSEGKPKGVVISHDNILANIAQIRAVYEFGPRDKFLSALPLFHSFGLNAGFLLPFLSGARIYLYPSPLHYRIIPEMAYDRDCTVMFATNTFLGNYAKRANAYDFRSVRYVVSGAEKLTDEVRRTYMDRFGVRIMEGYGATECSPVVAVNTPMNNRPGTVGQLLPGIEHELEPVPGMNDCGLLHVRGANVMLGYWRESNPGILEAPTSAYGRGWYPTGDIASIDAEGYVTLLGRMKRFAKVAGEMVSLEVVEKIAEAASPESVHAASTRPDPGRGESILLFTQDPDLKREKLAEAARALGAPDLAVPRRIIHINSIPLLGSGKKDYPALQRLAEDA
jgi:acyl-[acyl-carrier-protein]-phospholipid O-acyltransferase/long-chain-fatty-acid--[acyl-carrier-protein] ligase